MLVEPRHDLDEIARARAVIELRRQDAVPCIAAGAGRTRQAEDEGRVRDARGGAALYRGGADLGMAQHVEGDGKSIHPLFEQRFDRFGRHVAAGKTGAAGGDDDIDARIRNPPLDDAADRVDVIGDDLTRREMVTGRGETFRQRRARLVIAKRARIRNRQHRNVERHELFCLVDR